MFEQRKNISFQNSPPPFSEKKSTAKHQATFFKLCVFLIEKINHPPNFSHTSR